MIHHWCSRSDGAPPGDDYLPASYAADGFVHCSYLDQITATADALYSGRDDLVLLSIDEAGLPVVVEDCDEIGEPYPHVYGSIPQAAVRSVIAFPCLPDGSFALPDGIPEERIEPPQAASALAGSAQASAPVVGRMLARLTACAPGDSVLEIGTGGEYGAAWIASGLRPGQRLVTVEVDAARAAAAREALAGLERVEVVAGDWQEALSAGPFGLVFVEAGPAKGRSDLIVPKLEPDGVAVLDDLTPRHLVSAEFLAADPWRQAWLGHPGVTAAERQVSRQQAAIVARRSGLGTPRHPVAS